MAQARLYVCAVFITTAAAERKRDQVCSNFIGVGLCAEKVTDWGSVADDDGPAVALCLCV